MKENTVFLYGMVLSITADEGDEENDPFAVATLQTIRRTDNRDPGERTKEKERTDRVLLYTQNADVIKNQMLDLEVGDFVRVKGVVHYVRLPRAFKCSCGHITERDGVSYHVLPISIIKDEIPYNESIKYLRSVVNDRLQFIDEGTVNGGDEIENTRDAIVAIKPMAEQFRRSEKFSDEFVSQIKDISAHLKSYQKRIEAGYNPASCQTGLENDRENLNAWMWDKLRKNAEFSNLVFLAGTLCIEPEYYDSDEDADRANNDSRRRFQSFQCQIAENREYRVIEDGPLATADYPWIKAYGAMAEELNDALHQGSSIFINGAIQSRQPVVNVQCEECGATISRKMDVMDIVPYHVEYVKNCITPSENDDYDEEFEDEYDEAEEDMYEGEDGDEEE